MFIDGEKPIGAFTVKYEAQSWIKRYNGNKANLKAFRVRHFGQQVQEINNETLEDL